MGLFRKKARAAGGASPSMAEMEQEHGEVTTVDPEPVRKVDGTVGVQEVDGKDYDETDRFPLGEKGFATGRSYSVDSAREQSYKTYGTAAGIKKASQIMVSADMLDDLYEDEYDDEEPQYYSTRKWRTSRLQPGEVFEKPWKEEKEPRKLYERLIFAAGCFAGGLIGFYLIYHAWTSVTNSDYCELLSDNFSLGINTEVWNFEVQRGGFGSGTFEWSTTNAANVYTDSEGLHLVPTITTNTSSFTDVTLLDGGTLNLTADGTCTSTVASDCVVQSNTTSGAIINPVQSARLNTKNKMAIKYGKVEVVAKMPQGDWLWPAIWMLPRDDVYGGWPASGEIDIAETRGNAAGTLASGGREQVSSTLHWGLNSADDAYYLTTGTNVLRRTDYSLAYHTYGFEWAADYLFMYIDSRLLQVFFLKFAKGSTMWDKGNFGASGNESALNDPWNTGRPNTPFDEYFYLILNVAVGGTNGFFVDAEGNKPWVDDSTSAQLSFWDAVDSWYPTWGDGSAKGMTVKSVRMWELGKCG